MKVRIGTATEAFKKYSFPRDGRGVLDLINGTYTEERENTLNTKHPDEVRRCCDNASISLGYNNKEIGVRCKPFNYSGKTIISIKDNEELILKECLRVNKLKDCEEWKEPKDKNLKVYCNDPIIKLKGVHKK